MSAVIDLSEYRKKKDEDKGNVTGIKQEMRKSLDNAEVMRRYKIKEPTFEERAENIRKSIARVNALMAELKEKTDDKNKV